MSRKKRAFQFIGISCLLVGAITAGLLWQLGYFAKPATYNIQLTQKLKAAASVPIGAAVDRHSLESDSLYRTLVLDQFNSIVAEWEMKMSHLLPVQDEYEWEAADYLVNFAQENNLVIHGHTLLWHGAYPGWLDHFTGEDAEFEAVVKTYIQTVVTRYKGKIASWDVVNEAFDGEKYRDTVFYRRLGPDYIKHAFLWAHEADPSAVLYYNDYNMLGQQPAKVDFVIQEIEKLRQDAVPIQGIGIQGHLRHDTPNLTAVGQSLQKWATLGLKVRISELDIAMNYDGRSPVFSDEVAAEQKQRYHDLVALFFTCPTLTGITTWGVSDAHTWIPQHQGHPDWPLLFDAGYKAKPAAEGFLVALQSN